MLKPDGIAVQTYQMKCFLNYNKTNEIHIFSKQCLLQYRCFIFSPTALLIQQEKNYDVLFLSLAVKFHRGTEPTAKCLNVPARKQSTLKMALLKLNSLWCFWDNTFCVTYTMCAVSYLFYTKSTQKQHKHIMA